MTIKQENYSYGISYGKDNPYIFGIACIIAGVALGLPMLFVVLIQQGIIHMSETAIVQAISLYAGGITVALALSMTLPKLVPASHAVKITGKIADFTTGSSSRSGQTVYSPVVEYEYEGQLYRAELSSWSSNQPVIGNPVSLRVNPKKPNKIVSKKEVVFCVIALVVFSAAGVLFGSLGFIIKDWESQSSSSNADAEFGFIIWGGFVAFWLLLGIIICLVTKKKHSKQTLKETGIKTSCMIVDVNVNENVEINGMNPAKLTCSADGKMYTIKTKVTPDKCEYRAGQTIDLYFDPNNDKRFYADI